MANLIVVLPLLNCEYFPPVILIRTYCTVTVDLCFPCPVSFICGFTMYLSLA